MKGNDRALGRVTLALLLIGASVLARKGTEQTWTLVTDKPAPRDQSNLDVDMGEAVAWAVVSGAIVGLARLLVRRKLAYRGSPIRP